MIGIFDSGSGGLTVLKALRERAPDADVVYFGDLKNAPYGNKSREELGALTVLGIQKLIDEGATEIVSACNSVSVSIVLPMFEILDIPRTNIIEMVGPTVAQFKGAEGNILVVATRATIESRVYQDGFRMIGLAADGVSIPELVTMIEEGASVATLTELVRTALAPYRQGSYTHVVLGCTHFPLIEMVFRTVLSDLGSEATLVDPARAVANTAVARYNIRGTGATRLLISEEGAPFRTFAAACCGANSYTVTVV